MQYWKLDSSKRNDSFIWNGQNITGFDLHLNNNILPLHNAEGPGLIIQDATPFIFQVGCPLNNETTGILITMLH